MVSKIIVPERFLEQIRCDAERETKRGRETRGILLGLYENENDSIVVSRIHRLPSLICDGSVKGEILDIMKVLFLLPQFLNGIYIQSYIRLSREKPKTPAAVRYHSHPHRTSWSDFDVNHPFKLPGFVTADILYSDIYMYNGFSGLDNNRKSMHVYGTK